MDQQVERQKRSKEMKRKSSRVNKRNNAWVWMNIDIATITTMASTSIGDTNTNQSG
ncbi:hypothetical protein E2542_SST02711 [Spatholobus suberectus]|nr:hypothetical protein E2542_SST02711 [Spatholobus suberectus]